MDVPEAADVARVDELRATELSGDEPLQPLAGEDEGVAVFREYRLPDEDVARVEVDPVLGACARLATCRKEVPYVVE